MPLEDFKMNTNVCDVCGKWPAPDAHEVLTGTHDDHKSGREARAFIDFQVAVESENWEPSHICRDCLANELRKMAGALDLKEPDFPVHVNRSKFSKGDK